MRERASSTASRQKNASAIFWGRAGDGTFAVARGLPAWECTVHHVLPARAEHVLARVDQPLLACDRILVQRVGGHARILADACVSDCQGSGSVEGSRAEWDADTVRPRRN
jgi:hypothetical protein